MARIDQWVMLILAFVLAGVVLAWPRQPKSAEMIGYLFALMPGSIFAFLIFALLVGAIARPFGGEAMMAAALYILYPLSLVMRLTIPAGKLLFLLWVVCLVFGERPDPEDAPAENEESKDV